MSAPEPPAAPAPQGGLPEVDDLYGIAPADFTAARNALVKQIKASGDKAGAADIAKLRRPPITAWALNQMARHDVAALDAVLRAGDDLRAAMDRALGGDASTVRGAQLQERVAVDAALDAAVRHLEAQGHKGAEAARQRMAQTLRAALVDDQARTKLQRGVLDADVDASGFGMDDLAGFTFAPTPSRPADLQHRGVEASARAGAPASDEGEKGGSEPEPPLEAEAATEHVVPPQPDPLLVQRVAESLARREEQRRAVEQVRRRLDERRVERERAEHELVAAEAALAEVAQEASTAEAKLYELESAVAAAQQALDAELDS